MFDKYTIETATMEGLLMKIVNELNTKVDRDNSFYAYYELLDVLSGADFYIANRVAETAVRLDRLYESTVLFGDIEYIVEYLKRQIELVEPKALKKEDGDV